MSAREDVEAQARAWFTARNRCDTPVERASTSRAAEIIAALLTALAAERAAHEATRGDYEAEYAIVDRVWKALDVETYEQAGGKSIDELVMALRARVAVLEHALWRSRFVLAGLADLYPVTRTSVAISQAIALIDKDLAALTPDAPERG